MINTIFAGIKSFGTTAMSWVTSLMGALVPDKADAEGKSAFTKWVLIIAALYFGSKILRLNLATNIGGGKRK